MEKIDGPITLEAWLEDEARFRVTHMPHDRFVEILSVREDVVHVPLRGGLARWWSGRTAHPVLSVWCRTRGTDGLGKPAIVERNWSFADTPVARATFGLPAKA